MSDVEWTNDLVIRLMMEYKKRPELWDSTHDHYRAPTVKYEAWSDLANLFECDIVDLRKKLNSILASHRREKAKVRCGGRSTWFLYPHMNFLPTHIQNDETSPAILILATDSNPGSANQKSKRRKRILNIPIEEAQQSTSEDETIGADDYEEPYDHDDTETENVIIKTEPIVEYPKAKTKREVKYIASRKPRAAKVIKRRAVKEKHIDEDRNILMETIRLLRRSDLLKKKDECDSFGEYIADSLRKHDERTQSMIKQAINNILFEQEMKKYSTSQYTVVVPGMDVNPLILSEQDHCEK